MGLEIISRVLCEYIGVISKINCELGSTIKIDVIEVQHYKARIAKAAGLEIEFRVFVKSHKVVLPGP
jgi:hypothetical protein